MAEDVVHRLEAMQVDVEERSRRPLRDPFGHPHDLPLESAQVQPLGERVVIGHVLERAREQRAFGDVDEADLDRVGGE